MSGGGALLRNIDKLLTQVTGVPCHVAENPLNCVALGHRPGARALRLLQEVARSSRSERGRGRRRRATAPRRCAEAVADVGARAGRASVRRPALPHVGELRFAVVAGGRAGGGRARPDPPRDHRPRPDRRRARGARRRRPPGLTVIVGEEVRTRRRRPDRVFLERPIPPGLSAVETIAAAREQGGLVGIPHPFDRFRGSLLRGRRRLARRSPALVDWVETPQRPVWSATATSAPPSSRASTGCPASRSRTPTRSSRSASRTPRSTATRRRPTGLLAALAGGGARPRPGLVLRPALTPVAKVVQRVRGNGRVQPAGDAARARRSRAGMSGAGRTGPSADGRRRDRPGSVGRHGGDPRSTPPSGDPSPIAHRGARGRPEPRSRQLSLGQRLRQPRTILSIVVPLAIIAVLPVPQPARLQLDELPELILQANPRWSCSRVRRLLPRLPAARLPLGAAAARDRLRRSASATRPRSLTSPGSSTASCRPSSATSTAPTCSRSTARRRSAGPSGPSSSSASSTCSRSPSSAWRRLLELPDGLPPAVRIVFVVGVVVVVVARASGCSRCATSAAGSSIRAAAARTGSSSSTTGSRRASSAVGLRAAAGARRPDRPDLDDRGAAPVLRRPGARLPRRPARASAARSSSR